MPDIKIWYAEEDVEVPATAVADISEVVAQWMSCWVPKKDCTDGYEYYELVNEEIDITVLQPFFNSYSADMIIEVAAYDFPDRMRNIGERIEQIAHLIKRRFNLSNQARVSITFIPINEGHWTKV